MFYAPARRAYIPQMHSVDRGVERMLANALRSSAIQTPRVTQDDKSVTLSLDIPGLAREQISITIDANVVRIENVQDAPRHIKLAYELAQDIDVDASEARLENGVLTLKLAHKAVVPTARSLPVS